MKITKEVKVGVFSLFIIVLLVWGINFLKGNNIFSSSKEVYTVYPNVDGLAEASPILINGYQVGVVQSIVFHPNQSGDILVKLLISEKGFKIPKNSSANLISSDLLGTKAISLEIGDSKEEIASGDTINSITQRSLSEEVNQQILPLKKKAEDLLSSIDSVMQVITAVLDKETRNNVAGTFESIEKTMKNLERTSKKIDILVESESGKIASITNNINQITGTFNNNKEEIDRTIKNFATISDSIAAANLVETINNTSKTLEDLAIVMEQVKNGEGSLGKIIHSDSLYNNLDSASKNLDRLLIDMKEHPNRYVHFSIFGRKEKTKK